MKNVEIERKFLVRKKDLCLDLSKYKHSEISQGFIYIKNHKPTNEITDIIKWLDEVSVHCYFKQKDTLMINILNEKYPEYKGLIWLY